MAILDFKPKGDLFTTVAVGVGVAAAPVVIPLAWYAVRPLLKSILKGGFLLYETGRGACAEAAEWIGGEKEEQWPAVKAKRSEPRTEVTGREELALAQNLGLIEEQSVGKKAQGEPARPKPRPAAKTARKKVEKKK